MRRGCLAAVNPKLLLHRLSKRARLVPDRIDPADIDEAPLPGELPAAHAMRLAEEKARAVIPRHPGAYVLAADTVVADELHGIVEWVNISPTNGKEQKTNVTLPKAFMERDVKTRNFDLVTYCVAGLIALMGGRGRGEGGGGGHGSARRGRSGGRRRDSQPKEVFW